MSLGDIVEVFEEEGNGRSSDFSFSCYNLKNHPQDDVEIESDYHNDDYSSDEESFIEIVIEPRNEADLKSRISFSSSFSLEASGSRHIVTPTDNADSNEFVSSSSSSSSVESFSVDDYSNECKKLQKLKFRGVNRVIDTLMSTSTRVLSGIIGDQKYIYPSSTNNNQHNLLHNRINAPNRRTESNVMMKFLFKFRAMNLRSLLTSFMKTQRAIYHPRTNNDTVVSQKMTTEKKQILFDDEEKYHGGRKGVMKSLSGSIIGGKVVRRTATKSCPNSSNSSPVHPSDHHQVFDNYVQAAIAHCKGSFAQSID